MTSLHVLSVSLKTGTPVSFTEAFAAHLSSQRPDNVSNIMAAVKNLDALRTAAIGARADVAACGLLAVQRYYGQFLSLMKHFPVSGDEDNCAHTSKHQDPGQRSLKIKFAFDDVYSGSSGLFGKKQVSMENAKFEKACMLFNMAALHSQVASMQNMGSDGGRKAAAINFQSAAQTFQSLAVFVQSSFKLSRSSDFNTDLLYLLTQLMMAQAQEVFCYKAILEKKSDSIIAKLAAHAAKVYGQTAAAMAGVRAIDKSWKIVTEAKSAYHAAEADYRQALTLEEDDQYGQAVAYLRRAATQASTAERIGRQVKFQSPKALIATIQEALELAEHRSHIVYVQVIPDYKTWPLVEGHALAVADRPLPNFCAPEIMGEDLFSGISPASANTPADNIQHPKRSGSTGGKPSPAELRQNVADHSRKPSNRRSPSRGVSSGVGPVVHPSKSEARHDSARAIQQSKTWHIVIAAVIAVAAVMWFGWSSGSSDSAGPALEVLVPHGMLASERSMWNQTCSKKNGPIKFNGEERLPRIR